MMSVKLETSLLEKIEKALHQHCIDCWYPRSIDKEYGGFYSDFGFDWKPKGEQNKFIVSQARHVWSGAFISEYFDGDETYKDIAEHGFDFLQHKMWDSEHGGFYELVDRKGVVIPSASNKIVKTAYGNSFAIYGLARYYKISERQDVLDLAIDAFNWLEKHAYDPIHGGYFQYITREGMVLEKGFAGFAPKDQNSTIHMLEAYTELYSVWPDENLRLRLAELFYLVRDKICTEKGYMNLFFEPNWTPVLLQDAKREMQDEVFDKDHISFGHDAETAFLLLEAAELLGINDEETAQKTKLMVDHALLGWDNVNGGLFDGGYYFEGDQRPWIVMHTKEWWAQAEAMNAFSLMAKLYSKEKQYEEYFRRTWEYINKYLLDHQHGGWYWGGIDQVPSHKFYTKGQIWQANYHTVRALIHCILRLRVS